MYMYAQSYYGMKDYFVAGYQFERFADSYPNSEKLEDVLIEENFVGNELNK